MTLQYLTTGPSKKEAAPTPDEYTSKEQHLLSRVSQAKEVGKLTQKQLLALEASRHLEHLENALQEACNDRKQLQAKLDDVLPRYRALAAIAEFDTGITTWAAIAVFLGNVLLAIAGFHDSEPGKEIILIAGLIISGLGTLFIIGIHKLWMPRANKSGNPDPKP
jgi:hypothetical protein